MNRKSYSRWVLMLISSFCVAYVRTQLQYGKSLWSEGIFNFLSSLVIHYFAIALVAMVVSATYLVGPSWVLPRSQSDSKTQDTHLFEIMDIVYLTALIGSLLIWFLLLVGLLGNGNPSDDLI